MDHVGNDLGPILLTGASGYLGRRVLSTLNAEGSSCVHTSLSGCAGEPCDLTDVNAVRALLNRVAPSIVIHCAAIVPKSASAYSDIEAAEASVAMMKTVADAARCRLVLASSMTVYGAAVDGPVDEERRPQPASAYGRGKWAAEQILFDRHLTDDVALRLPGLFGLPRRSGLLYNAARAFLTQGKFELAVPTEPWGAMAVDDAAKYLVRAALMPSDDPVQAVNVGYEVEWNVFSAVAQVAACCGVTWRPPSTKAPTFSMRRRRLESRYGTLPVTFHQRLAEFVDAVRHDLKSRSSLVC